MVLSEGDRLGVRGSITIHNVVAVVEQGVALFDQGGKTIDLSQLQDVDSSAVSMLLEWQREAASRNHGITFVNVPEKLKSLLRLYNLFELVELVPPG